MWPLRAKRSGAGHDPAPSRWSYRVQRLWLTPMFRRAVRIGVPFGLSLMAGTIYLSDEGRREAINMKIADLRAEVYSRPEFTVNLMAIDGASRFLAEEIRKVVPLDFPMSSFDLDLEAIRKDVVALAPVKEASLRIRSGGVLQMDIKERVPVAIWRRAGGLSLVDRDGIEVAMIEVRGDRADLPLIAGTGAPAALNEAKELLTAGAPLTARMRGLVRVGQRRWDVVLDRGQRIMLPAEAPVVALERVIALSTAQDALARDLSVVDMRLGARPTIRMNKQAVEAWSKIRKISVENNKQ